MQAGGTGFTHEWTNDFFVTGSHGRFYQGVIGLWLLIIRPCSVKNSYFSPFSIKALLLQGIM
jgi:hypothetical protein